MQCLRTILKISLCCLAYSFTLSAIHPALLQQEGQASASSSSCCSKGSSGENLNATGSYFLAMVEVDGDNQNFDDGDDVEFMGAMDSNGTAITKSNDTTFTINENGSYYFLFTASTYPGNDPNSVSDLTDGQFRARVTFRVDGNNVGDGIQVRLRGADLTHQRIVQVDNAPVDVSVRVTNNTLSLGDGETGSLLILRLNSTGA